MPLGIAALAAASPFWIRTAIATFLIAYAAYQLVWRSKRSIGSWGGRRADSAVGIAGGFLGGFAGLSGPLPLIWLHMRGGDSSAQRAIYQTFNVVVLMLATIGMAVGRQLTTAVLTIALPCLPATLLGAWIGARLYVGVSYQTFQRAVLLLLLLSGGILLGQAIAA